ncbi:MAG: glycosyltransferase [Steroidobacteraceae bacterium]
MLLLELGFQRLLQADTSRDSELPTGDPPETTDYPSGIPRLIFQTWKTRTQLPANYMHWSASFQQVHPEYRHVLWGDSENRAFITREFPWFLPFYDAYPREIFRADMVRPFFLFHYGGVYSDLDTECLRPLDEVLGRGDVVLGTMGEDASAGDCIPNAMMASAPRQLFWMLVITMAIEKLREFNDPAAVSIAGPEKISGPVLLKAAVEYYRHSTQLDVRRRCAWVLQQLAPAVHAEAGEVVLLAASNWYPINWINPLHQIFRRRMLRRRFLPNRRLVRLLFPKASLITYWTHSW